MLNKSVTLSLMILAFGTSCFSQDSTICITLKTGRLIQHDLEIKDKLDTLVNIQTKHIIGLVTEVNAQDSIIQIHRYKEVLYDSIIRNKDGIMISQSKIIKAQKKGLRVPWWTLPLAALIAWAVHP